MSGAAGWGDEAALAASPSALHQDYLPPAKVSHWDAEQYCGLEKVSQSIGV